MPKYDPTRPSQGPAAPRPFPGDHLKRTSKGRRPAEPPPQSPAPAEGGEAPNEGGGGSEDTAIDKPGPAARE